MEKDSRMNKCRKLRDKIIEKFVYDLKQTSFYQLDFVGTLNRCLNVLGNRKIKEIVCYGLGSFCNGIDTVSRYQLALLLLTYEHMSVTSDLSPVIEIYDPSFEQMDKDTLLTFTRPRFNLIEENEYCGRKITLAEHNRCVLIYMPHMDKYLYNNLLGVNWTKEQLKKLIVLGNSFEEMINNETKVICRSELHYMSQLVNNKGALVELTVDDSSFQHSDIFNSISFHIVDENWIAENSLIIRKSHRPNWTCVTNCMKDNVTDQ